MNITLVGILSTTFYFKNKAADRGEEMLEAEEVRRITPDVREI